jgi:hypothetical protein
MTPEQVAALLLLIADQRLLIDRLMGEIAQIRQTLPDSQ